MMVVEGTVVEGTVVEARRWRHGGGARRWRAATVVEGTVVVEGPWWRHTCDEYEARHGGGGENDVWRSPVVKARERCWGIGGTVEDKMVESMVMKAPWPSARWWRVHQAC
jgi:hypothetical protein